MTVSGNLDSRIEEGVVVEHGLQFHDSLGRAHDLTIRFDRQAFTNGWDWELSSFDNSLFELGPYASGSIGFDENGRPLLLPGQPEAILTFTFVSGARAMTGSDAIRFELDGLTGRAAGMQLRTNAPIRPTATPTFTPRPKSPTRMPTSTRTRVPTRTPAAVSTASPIATERAFGSSVVRWIESPLNVLASSSTTTQTMVFRVRRPLRRAQALVNFRGGRAVVEPIPTDLEPDVDYPVTIHMELPRVGQRLVGAIRIADGGRSMLGPSGRFMVALDRNVPTPQSTRMPSATPTTIGQPTRPRATVVFRPQVSWLPGSVQKSLEPGESTTLDVQVQSTGLIVGPTFHAFARSGVVQIDPATVPGRLEPGQAQTLRVTLTLPPDRGSRSENATLAVRSNGETIEQPLLIRLMPLG